MAVAVRIAKHAVTGDGVVVYRWVRDGSSGYVTVDEDRAMIRPCDADGNFVGQMSISRDTGRTVSPDPETRARFVAIAAAIFQEWERVGSLPEVISRSYG